MAAESFFHRWSKLKSTGGADAAPANTAKKQTTEEHSADVPDACDTAPSSEEKHPPTLDDVARLGPDSDYSAFVGQGVDKRVQRLAMRKLFSDAHFNSMDGLDVYIGDYNKADPIPAAMLASLQHAREFLDRTPDAMDDGAEASMPIEDAHESPLEQCDTPANDAAAGEMLAKEAAMIAAAALPAADPVPVVEYLSNGNVLIIGAAAQALPWAERLREQLNVSVLLTDGPAPATKPDEQSFPVFSGNDVDIAGWLGVFDVAWQQSDPVDPKQRQARFDLIFDLSPAPMIALHQPPQGYFAPGGDTSAQLVAAAQLIQMVGTFEKPKYFQYKERLCAHSRNRQTGCNACIDVCSAKAIEGAGDRIRVNPHLCVGCGACTTVCPSGALGYAYPGATHIGRRLKTMLTAYAEAGGTQPAFLFHSETQGRALITALGRLAKTSKAHQGLPARVIPMELHHTASVGIDLWLAAIAYGASGIAVLVTDEEAPQYVDALTGQMAIAQTILSGLGYAGTHFQLVRATTPGELDAALRHFPQGKAPEKPATFHVAADKRNTLDFALDHLYRNAPVKTEQIALPAGAPFGAIAVDTSACTLCMSCVGACPESALMDSQNTPQLRFVEKNCVQCGLCAATCPEDAITLVPRISFAETSKKAVVLNETQPFHCIRCGKPFGTLQMIEAMAVKLSQHGAFSGNLERIKMCGDCRVIDMMGSRREASILEKKRPY